MKPTLQYILMQNKAQIWPASDEFYPSERRVTRLTWSGVPQKMLM